MSHEIIDGRLWDVFGEGDNRIVFHFNKKHNEDAAVPPWVIKHRGRTIYCDNVFATVPFTTRNRPDHDTTKGSLTFHGRLRIARTRYINDVTCESAYDAHID